MGSRLTVVLVSTAADCENPESRRDRDLNLSLFCTKHLDGTLATNSSFRVTEPRGWHSRVFDRGTKVGACRARATAAFVRLRALSVVAVLRAGSATTTTAGTSAPPSPPLRHSWLSHRPRRPRPSRRATLTVSLSHTGSRRFDKCLGAYDDSLHSLGLNSSTRADFNPRHPEHFNYLCRGM